MKRTRTAKRVRKGGTDRSRARSEEDKRKVRRAFIDAGRKLFATSDPERVSIRQIAAKAGYTPGTVYQYFPDQRSLLVAIREQDMADAFARFEEMAKAARTPRGRVLAVFLGAAEYWLNNFTHYRTLFEQPPDRPLMTAEGVLFGHSSLARNSYALYQRVVEDYLKSVNQHSVSAKFATDCLIAATHGMIAFRTHTPTLDWSPTLEMVREVILSLMASWAGTNPLTRRVKGRASSA